MLNRAMHPNRRRIVLLGAIVIIFGVVVILLNLQQPIPQFDWEFAGSTLKINPNAGSSYQSKTLALDAARGEYAPFQIVFRPKQSGATVDPVTVETPIPSLSVTLYGEKSITLKDQPPSPLYAAAKLNAEQLPDGLTRLPASFSLRLMSLTVIWVDIYVQGNTPPGSYTLKVTIADQVIPITLTVYPVDLPASSSISVIIPITPNWTMPFYAPQDPDGLQLQVNALLLAHRVIPGSFVAKPIHTANGWDFSPLTPELMRIPRGALFYTPTPYDAGAQRYLLQDAQGNAYRTAHFDDPVFVQAAQDFLNALAAYLRDQQRLDDALFYPVDETRWVGDEPIHNGVAGFTRLAQWAKLAHNAGLHVIGSGVTPTAPGPASLGWDDPNTAIDVSHVEVDTLDGASNLFTRWTTSGDHRVGLYLNGYGDQIDMSGAIQRGLLWHAYGRGVPLIAGYAAMQWVNQKYDLVDPWTQTEQLFPQAGYGGGALVWPGPQPSIRLKLLREGLEDTALLDLYAQSQSQAAARALARCFTPGRLMDQNPPPDQWDTIHTELLRALSEHKQVALNGLCPLPVLDMDSLGGDLKAWDFTDASGQLTTSPWIGQALTVTFSGQHPEAGYWLGTQDWSGWSALQLDVKNDSPYFTTFNVGLSDDQRHFTEPVKQGIVLGPDELQTVRIPLRDTSGFDFTHVQYLSIQTQLTVTERDSANEERTYPLGDRQLTFDNFVLIP